jgi:hypothetical protein
MEEDKPKRPLIMTILIIIQILIGLAVIWILCSIASALITYGVIYACHGECNLEHIEQYDNYIKVGYGIFVSVCFAAYLRFMNNKYHLL